MQADSTEFSAQGIRRQKSRYQPGCFLTLTPQERINFQSHCCCWKNPVPCDRGPEVPVFLLVVSWGTLRASKRSLLFFVRWLLPSSSQQQFIKSLWGLYLSDFLFCCWSEKTFCILRFPLTKVHPDNLCILRLANLGI